MAYTEELIDEKSVTARRFWVRAVDFFAAHGMEKIHRALTDIGIPERPTLLIVTAGTDMAIPAAAAIRAGFIPHLRSPRGP